MSLKKFTSVGWMAYYWWVLWNHQIYKHVQDDIQDGYWDQSTRSLVAYQRNGQYYLRDTEVKE